MREPLIIGHRGAPVVALENTLPAFAAAIAAGADGIEFDVRLSSDGVPVIIHDDMLTRTHGVRRRVVELTVAELRSFGVPSLRELFELMSENGLLLCLEIKSREAELAGLCCRLVREFGFAERIIIECFDLSVLRYVDLRKAALFEPRMQTEQSVIDRSLAVGATVLALHHRMAKPSLVEKAKLAGLTVVVWTIDDPLWVATARSLGIAALITNDPARMLGA
jgi:glycerophosphoryl diester phosphodiesterase